MENRKIIFAFGTRPEAIKLCPLIDSFIKCGSYEIVVINTGQHKEMVDRVLEMFNLVPDYSLHIMKHNQSLMGITESIIGKVGSIIADENPDMIIVQGDTISAFLVALCGFYSRVPIAHVEAGLRTYNQFNPYPEEANRKMISSIASLHFAPSENSKKNLIREGIDEKRIYIVGNTVIDTFYMTFSARTEPYIWETNKRLILLTIHRRETCDDKLVKVFGAIKKILQKYIDIDILFPIHMNPQIRKIAYEIFENCENINIIEPVNFVQFHELEKKAYLVITDSGGIVEETTFLGTPTLVVRDFMDREEAVANGNARVIGTDEIRIYDSVCKVLDNENEHKKMCVSSVVYGDGKACRRIIDITNSFLNKG